MFVGGISAFTFTGNASAAFSAGPTFLVIYLANFLGFLLCMIIGPWFRQTRCLTWADIMRDRFGVSVEQFSAILGLLLAPLSSAIQLYALAIFANTLIDVPVPLMIIVLGSIAVIYSTTGGRWAVMATDFVQGLIMFAVTLLVFYLSLKAIGGWKPFFAYFSDPSFADDFKWVKEPGEYPQDKYTYKWMIAIFLIQIKGYINLGTAGRFLSVKDGREARKSALFAAVLMLVGTVVWFLPPMVARFMMESEVLSLGIKEPATASYAVIAQSLLPQGLMGLLLAAMFAATMSSMDSGLNGTTGTIVNNIIPWVRRLMKLPELSDRVGLRWCRLATVFLGVEIIIISVLFAVQKEIELFDAFFFIGAMIGLPLGVPIFIGLWVKRLHWASYYIMIMFALLPQVYFYLDDSREWYIQDRLPWIYLFGLIGMLLCIPLWRFASMKYRDQVNEFFKRMHTPVVFEDEIGEANDHIQLRMIGVAGLVMAGLISLLLIVPNELAARMQILFLVVFMASVGGFLTYMSVKASKANRALKISNSIPIPDDENKMIKESL